MSLKYFDIKSQLEHLLVFSTQDIYLVDPNFRQSTLYDWEKSGKVTKLRNNRYIFSDFGPHNFDFYLLSNKLYIPSYVSTELALSHYSIIPEGVSVITAISTNKTKSFNTPVGIFQYQSIQSALFFGYELLEYSGRRVKIASLEKAILDYLYLHTEISSKVDFESLRWNREELAIRIDNEKFAKYLKIFDNHSLETRVSVMRDYLKK